MFFGFGKVAFIRGRSFSPVNFAGHIHITKSLLGMRIVASYLVLVELGNSDSRQNADDCNYDPQFYECETFAVL